MGEVAETEAIVESVESVESAENVENVESAENAENAVNVESVESAETVESVENVESVESAETVETAVIVDDATIESRENPLSVRMPSPLFPPKRNLWVLDMFCSDNKFTSSS